MLADDIKRHVGVAQPIQAESYPETRVPYENHVVRVSYRNDGDWDVAPDLDQDIVTYRWSRDLR